MPMIHIDGRAVEARPGETVLAAARRAGIEIPTLCHFEGIEPQTSCMVCVVKLSNGRVVPACGTTAVEGMTVESESAEVLALRRGAVELLLAEHVGDCEAPCRLTCPTRLDIPAMLRAIAAGDEAGALMAVRSAMPLPGVLGCICPAPCERTCRRGGHDSPLAIRDAHRRLAERTLGDADFLRAVAAIAASTGRRIAVVGAGPAGLAAAQTLALAGHAVEVFDDQPAAGGAVRREIGEDRLPRDILDGEVAQITSLGVTFRQATLGEGIPLDELAADRDAVLLAVGPTDDAKAAALGLDFAGKGIAVDAATGATSRERVFAAGACVRPMRLAVQAVAAGRSAALEIEEFLTMRAGASASRDRLSQAERMTTRIGTMPAGELAEMVANASPADRPKPADGEAALAFDQLREDASRCLHCDCRKPDACRLRSVAETLGAGQPNDRPARRTFTQDATHPAVVVEPGKCIACGVCIRLAERAGMGTGPTMLGRGFAARLGLPLGGTAAESLGELAVELARACPTGAIALRE